MTTHWPNHVFCFLLAVPVVNVQNAVVYFCALPKVNALKAHKLIAQQLIENKYARTWEEHKLIAQQLIENKNARTWEESPSK